MNQYRRVQRWGTGFSLFAVVVSLSCFAAAGTAPRWALILDAFAVSAAIFWIWKDFA